MVGAIHDLEDRIEVGENLHIDEFDVLRRPAVGQQANEGVALNYGLRTQFGNGESVSSRLVLKREVLEAIRNFPDWSQMKEVLGEAVSSVQQLKGPLTRQVRLARSRLDLVNSFWLRNFVYGDAGYGSKFDVSKGLEYDGYDKNSVTFLHEDERDGLVASSRVVLDGYDGLPFEEMCSFEPQRKKGKIAEPSRMVVLREHRKKGINKKNLQVIHEFGLMNKINSYVFCVPSSHVVMYENLLRGFEFLKGGVNYKDFPDKLTFFNWELSGTGAFN